MNILLLGKDGQVGRELTRSLLPLGQLSALGRAELDLTDLNALHQILGQIKPDLIVNAAAYTAVDKAETDKITAYKVNAELVGALAQYAKRNGLPLIHYSTDYVFDGNKLGAYVETDHTNPLNIYGESKLAGEQAILESGCLGYIFRTSWVYSARGHNFIKTILDLAKQRETLSIVSDQHGAPTSAELISDISCLAIMAARQDRLQPGIYHLTASGVTTWYDLARYVIEKALASNIELKIDPSKINPILTEAYPLPAARPKNSVLNNQTLASNLQIVLPDWRVYIDRMLGQLIELNYL
ncbi:dTDP-4-dehydrorhamnose reductase [Legionella massiliensis]|uniref:dTDP-4-dehydrorhamnose reductase n=1 Tax=Legionella massiliensis TaxID=1034943 RepID=A0A078KWX6_9GAMM|nr:dTDP-4-dehydrorhamnose reductase [Legionella massiliensis]CDZ76238.1 dTDP-4-dehydrorhamnose reductase [Legionella massiliensis]CEE11976.1 dTDP-4-dehydrorhamnose reductase [Legionella massiliensis]